MFMRTPSLPLCSCGILLPLWLAFKLVNNDVGIAIRARRTVVIKAIAIVRVSSSHQHGFQAHTGQAVGSPGTPILAHRRLWERNGSFWGMVENADSSRNAGADHRARHGHTVVVVGFHPIVVENANLGSILVIQPEWLDSS